MSEAKVTGPQMSQNFYMRGTTSSTINSAAFPEGRNASGERCAGGSGGDKINGSRLVALSLSLLLHVQLPKLSFYRRCLCVWGCVSGTGLEESLWNPLKMDGAGRWKGKRRWQGRRRRQWRRRRRMQILVRISPTESLLFHHFTPFSSSHFSTSDNNDATMKRILLTWKTGRETLTSFERKWGRVRQYIVWDIFSFFFLSSGRLLYGNKVVLLSEIHQIIRELKRMIIRKYSIIIRSKEVLLVQ